MKRIDLRKQYTEEIEAWDWQGIKNDALKNLYFEEYEPEQLTGSCYLGSCLHLYPSGKFYMPWTSNQTFRDVVKDSLFVEILESIAEKHDLWIGSGEGNFCDVMAFCAVDHDDFNDNEHCFLESSNYDEWKQYLNAR